MGKPVANTPLDQSGCAASLHARTRVVDVEGVEAFARLEDLAGHDVDVRGHALRAAAGLD